MTVDLLDQAFLDAAAKHEPDLVRPVGDLENSSAAQAEIVADLSATAGETVAATETVQVADESSADSTR